MNLLDRYLEAVKKFLPWDRQDDILAELRANLESQLEDKEAELGRPLRADEVEAWLKQIGPPTQMAARYQPQRYLIGPETFPIYWLVMRLAFLWAIPVYAIVNAVQIATETPNWTAVLQAGLRLPYVLLMAAAWITLVFAALEFMVTRYPAKFQAVTGGYDGWSSNALPDLSLTPSKKKRTYAHAVAEVIFGIIFLIWLLLVPQHPYVLWGPGAVYLRSSPFQLAPVWFQFYWCVVVLNIFQLGWRCVDLLRGTWRLQRPVQQIVMKAVGLIPLAALLSGQVWVMLKQPALDQAKYGQTADAINTSVRLSLTLVLVIVTMQLVWEAVGIGLNAYRRRMAATR